MFEHLPIERYELVSKLLVAVVEDFVELWSARFLHCLQRLRIIPHRVKPFLPSFARDLMEFYSQFALRAYLPPHGKQGAVEALQLSPNVIIPTLPSLAMRG